MKPKLIIDTISLLSSFTGIGRYTYEITTKIETSNQFNLSFYYGYISKTLTQPSTHSEFKNIKKLLTKSPFLKLFIRKILMMMNQFYSPSFDLYWQPNFIPINGIKAKKIVTSVHDFSFILHSDYHPKERIEYFETYFFKNIMKSDIIITGSEYTKQEILQYLQFPEEQIKVIYHGIDHHLFKKITIPNPNSLFPDKFILSVGSIEPRKNLLGLLKAYTLLEKEIKHNYPLLLAGFKGWENKEIMTLIEENRPYIQYLGFVDDKTLVELYNRATLFIYPSFYEGFGLPPLEAMSCGTPVVASNTTSIPEICSDAAVYCNPYDIEDICEQITLVLSDTTLQNSLIQKGIARASEFTWGKAAQEHIAVFQQVISK